MLRTTQLLTKTNLSYLLVFRILLVQTILDVDLVLRDGIAVVLAADVGNGGLRIVGCVVLLEHSLVLLNLTIANHIVPADALLGELKATLALHYASPVGLCLGSSNCIGGALADKVEQMERVGAVASYLAVHQHHVLQSDDGEVDLVLVVVVVTQGEGLVAVGLALGSGLEELGVERLA